jgi:hypothetical protein
MIKYITRDGDAEAKGTEVLINCDGDFACSEACADKYRRDHEFAVWMGVLVSEL